MVFRFAGIAALVLATTTHWAAAAVLFTTQQDFAGWGAGNANSGAASVAGDTDGRTINGLGNTSAAGAAGTAGALTITIPVGSTFGSTLSPGEQGNTAFLSAISGQIVEVDFNTAGIGGGNYFQLLINLNSSGGGYQTFAPTTVTGSNATFQTATYTLPTLATTGQSYFQFGFVANTNNNGAFTVDAIRTVPEPAAISVAGAAMLMALRRKGR